MTKGFRRALVNCRPKAPGLGLIGFAAAVLVADSALGLRPILESSPAPHLIKREFYRDLRDVTDDQLTGLNFEDSTLKNDTSMQAAEYITYRRAPRRAEFSQFTERCAKATDKNAGRNTGKQPGKQNPFCRLALDIQVEKAAARASSRPSYRADAIRVAHDIRSGDVKKLSLYPLATLNRGFNRFDSFAPLTELAQQVVKSEDCSQSILAEALGAKTEEHFPQAELVDLGRQLYRRAIACRTDAYQAHFRFSLISVWQGKCAEADASLAALIRAPEAHTFHSRAKYWRYFCAEKNGHDEIKEEMQTILWRDHPLTFHNLVVNAGDPRLQAVLTDMSMPKVLLRSVIRPDLNSSLRAMEAVVEAGATDLAAEMGDFLVGRLTSVEPEVRLYVAALMSRAGIALPKFKVLSALFQDSPRLFNRATVSMLYPKWYLEYLQPTAPQIDPLLLLSLIRQESAFNVHAHSPAGARGLMQVMPSTARSISSVRRDRLFDVRTNIAVGTKYFLHRLGRYNGDIELTLAAYNAGFSRVDRWIKRYPLENKLLFVDLIPYRETREYVSSIMRNYFWYTQLYGTAANAQSATQAISGSR